MSSEDGEQERNAGRTAGNSTANHAGQCGASVEQVGLLRRLDGNAGRLAHVPDVFPDGLRERGSELVSLLLGDAGGREGDRAHEDVADGVGKGHARASPLWTARAMSAWRDRTVPSRAEDRRTSLAGRPASRAASASYALGSSAARAVKAANESRNLPLLLPSSAHTRSASSGLAFFHASTFPTMLGVLDPASTSARRRSVCGGREKDETEPAVEGAVQAGLSEGDRAVRRSWLVICIRARCQLETRLRGDSRGRRRTVESLDESGLSSSPRHSTANRRYVWLP